MGPSIEEGQYRSRQRRRPSRYISDRREAGQACESPQGRIEEEKQEVMANDYRMTTEQIAFWARNWEEYQLELERHITEGLPLGDEAPELTPEDEAALDRAWAEPLEKSKQK